MKIKFQNEEKKKILWLTVCLRFGVGRLLSPDLRSLPATLKLEQMVFARTVCKERKKKVTVMREKAGSRRPDTGLEKNAEAGWWSPAWSGRQSAKLGCVDP